MLKKKIAVPIIVLVLLSFAVLFVFANVDYSYTKEALINMELSSNMVINPHQFVLDSEYNLTVSELGGGYNFFTGKPKIIEQGTIKLSEEQIVEINRLIEELEPFGLRNYAVMGGLRVKLRVLDKTYDEFEYDHPISRTPRDIVNFLVNNSPISVVAINGQPIV